MQCNIDERGVRYRRGMAVALAAAALICAAVAFWAGRWWLWLIAGVLAANSAFAIYEARHKWCVLRACGMKTRL